MMSDSQQLLAASAVANAERFSTRCVRPIVHALGSVLGSAGVAPFESLGSADAGADFGGVSALSLADKLERLARQYDASLGLHIARALPLGCWSFLDYFMTTSANVRDALTRVVSHQNLLFPPETLHFDESGSFARVVQRALPECVPHRQLQELLLGALVIRLRFALGGVLPLKEVLFTHPRPEDTSEHEAIFRAPLHFSGTAATIVFDRTLSKQPIPLADEMVVEALEARAARLGAENPCAARCDALLERTRAAITARLEKGQISLEEIARELRLSPRTLQRKLRDRSISLTVLADEVRRDEAIRLVASSAPMKGVAATLGFNDLSAFYRAFRRWTGSTPGAVRGNR